MRRPLALAVLIGLMCAASPAAAHPMEFGVMSLDERTDGRFEFEFRFSGGEDSPMSGSPWIDSGCLLDSPIEVPLDWGVHIRGILSCTGGLIGHRVGVVGLAGTDIHVPLSVRFRNGDAQSAVLSADTQRYRVVAHPTRLRVLREYIMLGANHIAEGVDHLLLVLGLVLASKRARDIALTVTSFTLGHSLTLALASLGVLQVPGPPIEACIALSLVLLAVELVRERENGALTRPWLLAMVFGLLHGLGFAGALAELGLPASAVGVALLGFNVGVELGQLAFVAGVLVVRTLAGRVLRDPLRGHIARCVPELVGAVSVYFLLDRLSALGG